MWEINRTMLNIKNNAKYIVCKIQVMQLPSQQHPKLLLNIQIATTAVLCSRGLNTSWVEGNITTTSIRKSWMHVNWHSPGKASAIHSPYSVLPCVKEYSISIALGLLRRFTSQLRRQQMSTHKHGLHWLVKAMVGESGCFMVTMGTDCQESKEKTKINHLFFVLLKINCFGWGHDTSSKCIQFLLGVKI